jgi:aryl-alcohol dehydrogenase-like predicted oxidoreductase
MHRKLGTRGPEVSALGFGCMGLNFAYGPGPAEQEAISLIREAFESGVNFTAGTKAQRRGNNGNQA